MLETPGSAGSSQRTASNNGWSTLGRSPRQHQQQQSYHGGTGSVSSNKSLTLRSRSRSRSRGAALHCLAVPEPSDEEEEAEDSYCYADWHQQESYQPALVVWTPGLNHPSSTPIKTATLRSALRSSITNNGD